MTAEYVGWLWENLFGGLVEKGDDRSVVGS